MAQQQVAGPMRSRRHLEISIHALPAEQRKTIVQ
jgi:hypothetical protein